eukprot:gene2430-8752_t
MTSADSTALRDQKDQVSEPTLDSRPSIYPEPVQPFQGPFYTETELMQVMDTPYKQRPPFPPPVKQPGDDEVWIPEPDKDRLVEDTLCSLLAIQTIEPKSRLFHHIRYAWMGANMRLALVQSKIPGIPLWYQPPEKDLQAIEQRMEGDNTNIDPYEVIHHIFGKNHTAGVLGSAVTAASLFQVMQPAASFINVVDSRVRMSNVDHGVVSPGLPQQSWGPNQEQLVVHGRIHRPATVLGSSSLVRSRSSYLTKRQQDLAKYGSMSMGRAGDSIPRTGRAGDSIPSTGRAGDSIPRTGRADGRMGMGGAAGRVDPYPAYEEDESFQRRTGRADGRMGMGGAAGRVDPYPAYKEDESLQRRTGRADGRMGMEGVDQVDPYQAHGKDESLEWARDTIQNSLVPGEVTLVGGGGHPSFANSEAVRGGAQRQIRWEGETSIQQMNPYLSPADQKRLKAQTQKSVASIAQQWLITQYWANVAKRSRRRAGLLSRACSNLLQTSPGMSHTLTSVSAAPHPYKGSLHMQALPPTPNAQDLAPQPFMLVHQSPGTELNGQMVQASPLSPQQIPYPALPGSSPNVPFPYIAVHQSPGTLYNGQPVLPSSAIPQLQQQRVFEEYNSAEEVATRVAAVARLMAEDKAAQASEAESDADAERPAA